jgi:hypothetical protein
MAGGAVKKTDKKRVGDGTPGPGRPKGVPNKTTAALKDMILGALNNKGGVLYLEKQADQNPTAFLSLVGKVLPMTVAGTGDSGEIIHRIELVGVRPQ